MSGKALALIGAALAAVVVVVVVASGGQEQTVTETPSTAPTAQSTSSANPNASLVNTVRYTNSKTLSPKNLTVKVGSPVTFINDSGGDIELESDPHPQHTSFPAFGSSQDPGEKYTFTFDKPMTLKYHNHLNPSVTGTITVEN